MPSWKELITTDNIGDYVSGGQTTTHDHSIEASNVTIIGVWNPTKRCVYIKPIIAHPDINVNMLSAFFVHQVYALSSNGLQNVHYTKEPDTQTTYNDSGDIGNGKIWSPAITEAINEVAISSPFAGGQYWKLKTAEISIGQTNQRNSFLGNHELKLVWGKFDSNQTITNIPGTLLDANYSDTSYNDEPAYKKITLPVSNTDPYDLNEWSSLGTTIWNFPGDTFNEGITNVDCKPQNDTFILSPTEKLIPFLYLKDDNYPTNGHYDFDIVYNSLLTSPTLTQVNIQLNFTTETVL